MFRRLTKLGTLREQAAEFISRRCDWRRMLWSRYYVLRSPLPAPYLDHTRVYSMVPTLSRPVERAIPSRGKATTTTLYNSKHTITLELVVEHSFSAWVSKAPSNTFYRTRLLLINLFIFIIFFQSYLFTVTFRWYSYLSSRWIWCILT